VPGGPLGPGPDDVVEVTLALAEVMLELAASPARIPARLADGSALRVYREMIAGQGAIPMR